MVFAESRTIKSWKILNLARLSMQELSLDGDQYRYPKKGERSGSSRNQVSTVNIQIK